MIDTNIADVQDVVPSIFAGTNGFESNQPTETAPLSRFLLVELGIEENLVVSSSPTTRGGLDAAEQLHDRLIHAGFVPSIDRLAIRNGKADRRRPRRPRVLATRRNPAGVPLAVLGRRRVCSDPAQVNLPRVARSTPRNFDERDQLLMFSIVARLRCAYGARMAYIHGDRGPMTHRRSTTRKKATCCTGRAMTPTLGRWCVSKESASEAQATTCWKSRWICGGLRPKSPGSMHRPLELAHLEVDPCLRAVYLACD